MIPAGQRQTGRPSAAGAILLSLPLALALLSSPAWAATAKRGHGPLLTLTSSQGESSVEAQSVRFVYFMTRYRHRRAPKDESPTGERIEIVDTRKECQCVRLADYSKIKMSKSRELAFSFPPGAREARVRITQRDGKVNEHAVSDLWGGDGLFPPRFAVVLDGHPREFPLILRSEEEAWPDETLARILLVRTPPPQASSKKPAKPKP